MNAGANAIRISAIGMSLAFQPRRAPIDRSALQRASDHTAQPRPLRSPW